MFPNELFIKNQPYQLRFSYNVWRAPIRILRARGMMSFTSGLWSRRISKKAQTLSSKTLIFATFFFSSLPYMVDIFYTLYS